MYTKFVKSGMPILAAYEFGGSIIVLFHEAIGYGFGWNYNVERGDWDHGHYLVSDTLKGAIEVLEEEYPGIEEITLKEE